jgi:predicted ATPase
VSNNWYVITGAPSAGKSTVIAELAKRGYATVEEQGRLLIDQELAKGKTLEEVNVDSPDFEVAWTKFQRAREAEVDPGTLTFFDRGRLDTLAYFAYYSWPIPSEITELCQEANYRKVFLLELLDYDKDYARVETAETAAAMQELFGKAYADAGYEVVRVPRGSVEERLTLILSHL